MKRWQTAFGLLLICTIPAGGCTSTENAAAVPTQDLASAVGGVFEYIDESREGPVFYQDGYYIHLRVPKEFPVGEMGLTDEDKIQLWNQMALVAGTYTVSGDTCTNTILYSKDPTRVGGQFRWVGSVLGDTIEWAVLDGEGGYSERGRSLRIR